MSIKKYKIEDGINCLIEGGIDGYNYNPYTKKWVQFEELRTDLMGQRFPYGATIEGGMQFLETIYDESPVDGSRILIYRMLDPWIEAFLLITSEGFPYGLDKKYLTNHK